MIARLIRGVLLLLPFATLAAGGVAAAGLEREGRDVGRAYTDLFYGGAIEQLWQRLSPALRLHIGSAEGLRAFRRKVTAQAGRETEVMEERVIPWLGRMVYNRIARFSRAPTPIWVQWTLDRKGLAQAFFVEPAQTPAPSRFLDYRTKTQLRLPFDGTWSVFWGGRSLIENRHAVARDQRFAYDLLVVRDDSTAKGNPFRNESYFCFGRPVLAPADGKVAAAVDDVDDNRPTHMNEEQPLGNYVVIDHGNGEYSFLAHLQRSSVQVRPGQKVTSGEELGRCGNSGRSTEPHLHYHLQTTPVPMDGDGLPAQFVDYVADGRPVRRGEPTRGQSIAPQ